MSRRQWWKTASVTLFCGATGFGGNLLAQNVTSSVESRPEASVKAIAANDNPVYLVKPGKLGISVVARGLVETARKENAYCKVEGSATILWVLPEGSLVAKGQLVCELDSTRLKEQRANQVLAEKQADANYQNAKLTREVAESNLREYTKEKTPHDQNTLKRLKDEIERFRSDESAKDAKRWDAKTKLNKLDTQIANCRVVAPGNGLLVHANDKSRVNAPPSIANGMTVRERQIIVMILDVAGPMQVNTKVRESVIKQVKRGLKARIRIDALPAEPLAGVVRSVAPLPDPRTFFTPPGSNVYSTFVEIETRSVGLVPDMPAEVEIFVGELDNVLGVPVEAVVRFDDKDHVAVKKPDGAFEWREVTLGQSNKRSVEVKQGIKSGELVATRPRGLLSKKQ